MVKPGEGISGHRHILINDIPHATASRPDSHPPIRKRVEVYGYHAIVLLAVDQICTIQGPKFQF